MIQEIQPKKLVNAYRVGEKAGAESIILFHIDGKFLARIDEEQKTITYPRLKDFNIQLSTVFLFSIDDEEFFLVNGADEISELNYPDGFELCDMKAFRREYLFPKHYVYAAFTALQLAEWYEGTVYCGKCGSKTKHSETERAKVCPNCGKVVYPRINPAVIVGVTNGDRLLLTKYRVGYSNNALVAGFTEIGETLEETVEREVMEETGLKVKNIRYYKSQPWGIASDILMGFYCDVDGDDEIKMDESELKYAQWVPREEIVLQPLEYSLTNEMMKMFKESKV
ncbi:NAD(+) diphosphatase [Pseudobutyrivibrio sp.]|uniref:NAD(+) diphosphatase n=1 Tax=Pseudobutyrivibrio sp. TaxID=2014367 RepID=UPI0025F70834|nr:NAD(+) diphosphatase [Pseudobutyrivibrio sp.]MBR5649842.1 NAD(+) diphosphatase [Pseudobutyrivibrio sp.]